MIIVTLFILINLLSFIVIGMDKKKSREHDLRIPEVYFFVWAAFFGSLGVLAGMFFFHHKTRKLSFTFGITMLLIQQLLLVWILSQYLFVA